MKRSKLILSVLTALFLTGGCTATYHVKRSLKHKEKAISKGLTIPKDTVTITKSDTITAYYLRNDTVVEQITIRDTVFFEPTVELKTRWQTRYEVKYKYKTVKVENRAMIDSLKQVVKQEHQKTKQTKAENRKSNWWKWLVLGLIVGYLLNIFINLRGINLNRNYD